MKFWTKAKVKENKIRSFTFLEFGLGLNKNDK